MRRAGRRRDIDAGADDARRAGGTMLRRAEVTEKVVVLELCREEKEGVERYADERPTIS
jgi:hypothetical protein